MDDAIEDAGSTFTISRTEFIHHTHGAKVVRSIESDYRDDLAKHIRFVPESQREELERLAPATSGIPYKIPGWRLVCIPEATVYCSPRIEGVIVTQDNHFVRETRGAPLIFPDTPYARADKTYNTWYFDNSVPYTGHFEKAYVGFEPATANYAHFLGIYLQRLIAVAPHLENTPFLFPDLPNYRDRIRTAMRNEFFFRLPEIFPLQNGNFYFPMTEGKWKVSELWFWQAEPRENRWDLMFRPEVREGFHQIAQEGVRRSRLVGTHTFPKNVYISRLATDRRRIVNEDQVMTLLASHGFEKFYLEQMDFWDQVALFAQAKKVIAMHGAGCANILFSHDTDLLELHPLPLPSGQFAHSALAMGASYSACGFPPLNRLLDIEIDIATFKNALEAFL